MAMRRILTLLTTLVLAAMAVCSAEAQSSRSSDVRLYVLDGGVLESDPGRYDLTSQDVETSQLSIASFLIVHPRGVLLWDAGAIADDARAGEPAGYVKDLVLGNGQPRTVTLAEPMLAQLAESGFTPDDVQYIALSHYHWDHSANANAFADATWFVNPDEREAMFESPEGIALSATFRELEHSETVLLNELEHDVFGDGRVVIRQAPGHTPGHLVLFVDLANTGPVVLSGDLYHYAAERRLHKVPGFDFDPAETAASREELEGFLARTGATLWIQHDLPAHRRLRKAPLYYD